MLVASITGHFQNCSERTSRTRTASEQYNNLRTAIRRHLCTGRRRCYEYGSIFMSTDNSREKNGYDEVLDKFLETLTQPQLCGVQRRRTKT